MLSHSHPRPMHHQSPPCSISGVSKSSHCFIPVQPKIKLRVCLTGGNPIYLDSASACFWMSCSAPRCWVLPVSCCFWYSVWAAVLPVMPATAPPTVPETRSAIPEPRSDSWPLASCCWPSRFCWRPWDFRDYVVGDVSILNAAVRSRVEGG